MNSSVCDQSQASVKTSKARWSDREMSHSKMVAAIKQTRTYGPHDKPSMMFAPQCAAVIIKSETKNVLEIKAR